MLLQGFQGAEFIQTKKCTHSPHCAAPTISEQPHTGWGFHQLPPAACGCLLPPWPKGSCSSWAATLLSSSPQRPVLFFRSTPAFWSKPHPPLSCLSPCPAENNALLSTQMSCSPLCRLRPTGCWSAPETALPPWGFLHVPSSGFSKSSKRPTLGRPTVHLGSVLTGPSHSLSLSLFLWDRNHHNRGHFHFTSSAPLAPGGVTHGY